MCVANSVYKRTSGFTGCFSCCPASVVSNVSISNGSRRIFCTIWGTLLYPFLWLHSHKASELQIYSILNGLSVNQRQNISSDNILMYYIYNCSKWNSLWRIFEFRGSRLGRYNNQSMKFRSKPWEQGLENQQWGPIAHKLFRTFLRTWNFLPQLPHILRLRAVI